MPVDIAELFSSLQGRLVADLKGARQTIKHPGDMGGVSEEDWRQLLKKHLPNRYSVAKATVVDCNGDSSDSIDIVIYDQLYSFLLMERQGLYFIPAEAVYAVIEVKQSINRAHIDYAGEKAASVRRLHRTSVATIDIRGDTPRKEPIRILSALIALTSDWKPMVGNPLYDALNAQDESNSVDIVCALDSGAVDARSTNGQAITLLQSPADSALLFTLMAILRRLQSVGTVAPMDMEAYARWLHE